MKNYIDPPKAKPVLDSGKRTEFPTGAVRDMHTGKGRNDLIPPRIAYHLLEVKEDPSNPSMEAYAIGALYAYWCMKNEAVTSRLNLLRECFVRCCYVIVDKNHSGAALTRLQVINIGLDRLAKLYEKGAEKYGELNWTKGIPSSSFYDSAHRHMRKHLLGQDDEDHLAAFLFNVVGLMYNERHHPDLVVLHECFVEGSVSNA